MEHFAKLLNSDGPGGSRRRWPAVSAASRAPSTARCAMSQEAITSGSGALPPQVRGGAAGSGATGEKAGAGAYSAYLGWHELYQEQSMRELVL